MRIRLEIPGKVFRRAKSDPKRPKKEFLCGNSVSDAVEDRLKRLSLSDKEKPWLKHFGKLKRFSKETKRINKAIEEAFEKIDPEVWTSLTCYQRLLPGQFQAPGAPMPMI